MSDPVQDYLKAKAALDDVAHLIRRSGQLLHRIGEALMGDPPRLVIEGTGTPNIPVPAGQTFWLDPNDWPSVDSLKSALADYHAASRNAHDLYQQLTPEVRANLQASGDRRAS